MTGLCKLGLACGDAAGRARAGDCGWVWPAPAPASSTPLVCVSGGPMRNSGVGIGTRPMPPACERGTAACRDILTCGPPPLAAAPVSLAWKSMSTPTTSEVAGFVVGRPVTGGVVFRASRARVTARSLARLWARASFGEVATAPALSCVGLTSSRRKLDVGLRVDTVGAAAASC